MDEKLLNKLVEVLKSHGLADEDIEKVKAELTEEKKPEEESKVEEEKVESETPSDESSVAEGEEKVEEKVEESEPVESEEPKEEEKVEEVQVEEEPKVEEPVEEPQPPVEEEPQELPEGVEEINPDQPQEVVEQPTESADYQRLLAELEEERKAREGLMARIESLEAALKESGVIEQSHVEAKPIGVDDPTRVQDYHDDDEMFDRILNDVNKPQY